MNFSYIVYFRKHKRLINLTDYLRTISLTSLKPWVAHRYRIKVCKIKDLAMIFSIPYEHFFFGWREVVASAKVRILQN